jgi:hypothetical protein
MRMDGLGKLKKKINLIGARTRDLPACSKVPQQTTLPHAPPPPPVQWAPWDISPRIKRPESETNHSLSSSAEVKDGGLISTTAPRYVFMAWCLIC